MSKDPAFLFYSSDFLTGCVDLTMEERGQYITLICLQHQKGHISEKTIRLSVGNVSVDVLNKFKKDENGLLYNERVEEEIEKRRIYAESRRKNGALGGRPKKPYAKPNGKPYDKPIENLPENEDENENKDKDKKYGELKNVRLTESQYKELYEKYNNLNLAIEKLDTWLGTSGSKNKNKNHYAYFKSNSWVWQNLQEKPDAFDLYTQLDKRKREETSRLARAAERTMEELRQKAMSKFGG